MAALRARWNPAPLGLASRCVAQTQGFAALRPGLSNLAPSGLFLATSTLLFDSSTSFALRYDAHLSCDTSARIRNANSSYLRAARRISCGDLRKLGDGGTTGVRLGTGNLKGCQPIAGGRAKRRPPERARRSSSNPTGVPGEWSFECHSGRTTPGQTVSRGAD